MKRIFILICFLYIFIQYNAFGEVNFMTFMIGGELEEETHSATADILEMLRVDHTLGVNVYIMAGGANTWGLDEAMDGGVTYLQIYEGNILILGEPFSTTCTTKDCLLDFINVCTKRTPSEENILIIWGHGCLGTDGVGYDALYGNDTLTLSEICTALDEAQVKIDILGFDACNMAGANVAEILDGYCKHAIAANCPERLQGWPYHRILGSLVGETEYDTQMIIDCVSSELRRTGENKQLAQLF